MAYETTWTHDDGTECDVGRTGSGWCGEHGMWMRVRVLPVPDEPAATTETGD